jgi:thioredoxin 2
MSQAIVICPTCGAKNRVQEMSPDLQPVCGRCGTKLPTAASAGSTQPVKLTDDSFASFLKSAGDRPVLVDFWAAWCGPCMMIAPVIDELAAEAGGRYLVGKLDTDLNPHTAQQYQVSALPTLLIFHHGRPVDRIVGLQPKAAIAQRLAGAMR